MCPLWDSDGDEGGIQINLFCLSLLQLLIRTHFCIINYLYLILRIICESTTTEVRKHKEQFNTFRLQPFPSHLGTVRRSTALRSWLKQRPQANTSRTWQHQVSAGMACLVVHHLPGSFKLLFCDSSSCSSSGWPWIPLSEFKCYGRDGESPTEGGPSDVTGPKAGHSHCLQCFS